MKAIILTLGSCLLMGCGNNVQQKGHGHKDRPLPAASSSWTQTPPFSRFIVLDSANKMIGSYLESIDTPEGDDDLRSVIVSADSLRAYLSDTSISHVKIMFAHTLEFINSGNSGKNAGYQSGALTFVLAGYNKAGDYVYYRENRVLQHSMPCPTNCVISGSASNNLLQ